MKAPDVEGDGLQMLTPASWGRPLRVVGYDSVPLVRQINVAGTAVGAALREGVFCGNLNCDESVQGVPLMVAIVYSTTLQALYRLGTSTSLH